MPVPLRTILSEEQEGASPSSRIPWLGVVVGNLDRATRAHAEDLPDGVGFLVKKVMEESPAAISGIQPYDIIWKLDDQLLVNESQLATLLRIHGVGARVKLAVVRASRHREVEVTLKSMPAMQREGELAATDLPLIPMGVPGMPRTIVYPQNRTAEISRGDGGVAKLFYRDEKPHVLITDAAGEQVYEGPVREGNEVLVPKEWRYSVAALLRAMSRAGDAGRKPRQPRPRVVPPAKKDE